MRHMYFIGVTTGASSIHRIFPAWAGAAGVPDAVLKGIDIPLNATPRLYREAIARVREDGESWGGLVTTHKVAVYRHAKDLFAGFDDDGTALAEINCIVRRDGCLTGMATDVITSALALRALVAKQPFRGGVLVLGAGGAALALAVHLDREHHAAPLILTDLSAERLREVAQLTPARLELVAGPEDHDRLLASMPPGTLVVNATGMGKDRLGCPITPHARFPADAIAWDFNYRGDLAFLDLARRQGIRAADGWEYFLHGWSQIMARVYGFDLTPELFARLREIARVVR